MLEQGASRATLANSTADQQEKLGFCMGIFGDAKRTSELSLETL